MHMQGHARDVFTPAAGAAPIILAQDRLDVWASPLREILRIGAEPERPAASALIGKRAGSHLRAAINEVFPDEQEAGSPLYLLLDDLAGASLVAGWAWSQWSNNWMARSKADATPSTAGRNGRMEGICTGFAPGSSALGADGRPSPMQSSAPVPPLPHPDDPDGWHELPVQEGVGMRRARRIDLWRDGGGTLYVDAGFQDSATAPAGGRIAVHEYSLMATADAASGKLTAVHARPHVLPYPECPGAAPNVDRLIGEPLATLRGAVLKILAGTLGCTHLNDALRALAEAPQLAERLEKAGGAVPAPPDLPSFI